MIKTLKMSITIKIDTKSKAAKQLLSYLKTLPFVKIEEEDTYDPEFVEKVLNSHENDKRHTIPTNDLWESI